MCDKTKTYYKNFKIKCENIALITCFQINKRKNGVTELVFLLHIKIGKFITLSIVKFTLSELSPLIWQSLKKSNQTQTRRFYKITTEVMLKHTIFYIYIKSLLHNLHTTLKICTFHQIYRPKISAYLKSKMEEDTRATLIFKQLLSKKFCRFFCRFKDRKIPFRN